MSTMTLAPYHGVAAGAVEDLVVRAQLVDVEQQQRDVGLVALCQREIALQHVLEVITGREPGEPVLAHPVRQAADSGLAVRLVARATFPVITHKVRDLPVRILERINLHVVDEHCAILAQIAQQRSAGLGVAQGVTQQLQFRLLAVVTLQKTQVLADQLTEFVTRQLAECRIGVHHDAIAAGFADHDAFGRHVERAAQEFARESIH
jgi:hypothetical protein